MRPAAGLIVVGKTHLSRGEMCFPQTKLLLLFTFEHHFYYFGRRCPKVYFLALGMAIGVVAVAYNSL